MNPKLQKLKKLIQLFKAKKTASIPMLIIRKQAERSNEETYNNMEQTIAALENDPTISQESIAALRASIVSLKKKESIQIRDGKIIP